MPNALPCGESLFIFLNEDEDLWEFATGIADEPVRVWRLKGNALSDLTREGWKIEGPFSGLCPELCPRESQRIQLQPTPAKIELNSGRRIPLSVGTRPDYEYSRSPLPVAARGGPSESCPPRRAPPK